ncbi:MAG: hypothetical protein K6F74_05480 [Prevotella sp.]|nr:hypothetical protein [Prevotella sp.]
MSTQPTTKDIMDTIPLTPSVIAKFTDFLVNPEKNNCTYKPLKECFVEGDHYEPQHLLYQQYVDYIKKPLPKAIFYIIMREQFPEYFGKDDRPGTRHDLGYKLKLNVEG